MGWRQAIIDAVTGVAGADCDVSWADEEASFAKPINVSLSISGFSSKYGEDEWRESFDNGSKTFTLSQASIRSVRVTVRCECFDHSEFAAERLSTIRNRLKRQATKDILRVENVALWKQEDVVNLPTVYDQRVISCAAFEATFGVAMNETLDTYPNIEKVSGTFVQNDGLLRTGSVYADVTNSVMGSVTTPGAGDVADTSENN